VYRALLSVYTALLRYDFTSIPVRDSLVCWVWKEASKIVNLGLFLNAILCIFACNIGLCWPQYKSIFSVYKALLSVYRALLSVHRALLSVYRALLSVYRAVWIIYGALLSVSRALWQRQPQAIGIQVYFEWIWGSFVCVWQWWWLFWVYIRFSWVYIGLFWVFSGLFWL